MEALRTHFRPEFDRLLMTVLMEPWDMQRDPELVERELGTAARRGKRTIKPPRAKTAA